jgi:hypothetical protein
MSEESEGAGVEVGVVTVAWRCDGISISISIASSLFGSTHM